jgi:hypothetical protein
MGSPDNRWTAPVPVGARNYPYHCWWVAALCTEVSRTLLGRWLLDTPVLLYRREDGTPWDRDNYGSFVSPALQVAAVDLIDPHTGSAAGRFRVSHATTPVDQGHMHYFWAAGRDFGTGPEAMATLEALTKRGFAEDEVMLEAIQALQQRDPRGAAAPEVSVKMDTAGVQARRIVARWMERDS